MRGRWRKSAARTFSQTFWVTSDSPLLAGAALPLLGRPLTRGRGWLVPAAPRASFSHSSAAPECSTSPPRDRLCTNRSAWLRCISKRGVGETVPGGLRAGESETSGQVGANIDTCHWWHSAFWQKHPEPIPTICLSGAWTPCWALRELPPHVTEGTRGLSRRAPSTFPRTDT